MSTNNVAKPSALSLHGDARLQKIRTLRGGVEAMRNSGRTYLPKEEGESDSDYEDRLNRSWLFPGLDKAIEDVADRVFSREVQLGEDVPESIAELAENITSEGRNLNTFARDVFEDGVEAGISFILADGPRRNGDETRADEIAQNLRPYLTHIQAEDVLGWQTKQIGNKTVVTQFRFFEYANEDDPNNPWEQEYIQQVRVLYRGEGSVSFEVYRKTQGDWAIHDSGIIDLPEIPVVAFYTNRTGFFQAKPMYEKLADLNIAHWQSASDQRNILHSARVPVLAIFGFEGDVSIGPNRAFVTSRGPSDADIKYIEHTGKAIEAGRDDLKDLEARMESLGLELLLPKTGNPTATGRAIDTSKAQTPLAMMANSLKDALEKAIDYMGQFIGLPPDSAGSVSVNTDFGLSLLGGADLAFLLQAVNTGQISRETFIRECIRRNVLMDDIDPDEEAERIEMETPAQISLPEELINSPKKEDE